jgi:hypothetical protein
MPGVSAAAAEDILAAPVDPLPHLPPWDESRVRDADEEIVISHNWAELRRFMWDYVGIVRTNKRLERALHRIRLLEKEIDEYYANFRVSNDLIELRNLVLTAHLIVRCAQRRHESRGLHFSRDYPDTWKRCCTRAALNSGVDSAGGGSTPAQPQAATGGNPPRKTVAEQGQAASDCSADTAAPPETTEQGYADAPRPLAVPSAPTGFDAAVAAQYQARQRRPATHARPASPDQEQQQAGQPRMEWCSPSTAPAATRWASDWTSSNRREGLRETTGGDRLHRRCGLDAAENQRSVGAAEAEVVLQRDVDLHRPRRVGAVVQVALRILVEDVDGRRRDLVMHGEHGEYRFQAAGAAQQVTGHRLGGIHHGLLRRVDPKASLMASVSFLSPSGVEVPWALTY